jgi:hypothetical protein
MRANPVTDLSGTDVALIVGGVAIVGTAIYLLWNASQQAAQLAALGATVPGPLGATSPNLSYAASTGPQAQVPITQVPTIGLAPGYYWEGQGTVESPPFGSSIEAIAMSPDDVASAVYGTVISGANSNVTFLVTSYGDPSTGLSLAQEVTLPLSYVVPA